ALKAVVSNIVWDLIVEGALRPGVGDGDHEGFPFIHVTEFGKERIADPASPLDPDGYMKGLLAKVPNADPTIVDYIGESQRTFRIDCRLASTITLGCASEKALLLLIDAYAGALANPVNFQTEQNKCRTIKQKHDSFMKRFDSHLKAKISTPQNSDWVGEVETA